MNQNMYLIYPGMTDFEEVEIIEPARDPGFCYVRPLGSDDELKVAFSRLVNRETAITRSSTQTIQRDGYTVTEHTVTAI